MRLLFKMTILLVLLAFARISFAEPMPTEATLGKSSIQKIKILGNKTDHIGFFLTDNNKIKYRLANLTQSEAAMILEHIKGQKELVLETEPNKRGYLDVVKWRKAP